MIVQNNVTVVVNERNQEQRNSKWSAREKILIGFSFFIYWCLIGIAIMCYIKFHPPVDQPETEIDNELGLLNSSEVCPNRTRECIERVAITNSIKRLAATVRCHQNIFIKSYK